MNNQKDIKQLRGKLPLEKIDPIALITLGKIQQYGAEKYKETAGMSWKHGEIETYIGALLRHLTSYQQGNIKDSESNFTHIEHLFFNAYVLLWLENKKIVQNSEVKRDHWIHEWIKEECKKISADKDYYSYYYLGKGDSKPVLTNAEKTILENIPEEYKYITRDEGGELYIYSKKPRKDEKAWYWGGFGVDFVLFNHLFNFIKWEDSEPYSIKELLRNK